MSSVYFACHLSSSCLSEIYTAVVVRIIVVVRREGGVDFNTIEDSRTILSS